MVQRPIAIGLMSLLAACSSRSSASESNTSKPLVCDGVAPSAKPNPGNPGARKAAQQGLDYLTKASREWTAKNHCFGCHVQGVTMDALAVGMHHQYDVRATDVDETAAALQLGVTAGGRVTGAAFEGQAWARYDTWVNGNHKDQLLQYTEQLVGLQNADGSVPDDDARRPVTGGTMHTTYQAMQTWRQAFARTADDKWLTPMRKAEQYLAKQSSDWQTTTDVYLQDINFALLGLIAAGVGPGEASPQRLQKILVSRQNQDGGWGLDAGTSDALATGQTLYALRQAGHGDGESAIDRATAWLVSHQGKDGAWRTYHSSQGGAEKGEGMWAVLGLVSIDVTSVAVNGLVDGQHVAPEMKITVQARDNLAGGVAKVELFVDDRPLAGACAGTLAYDWRTSGLADGKHTLDVIATNTKQQTSRRRYEVYAGNVFLTDLGTRFDGGRQTTEIGVRNIAATAQTAGKVELAIFATEGEAKRGAKVFGTEQAGTPGAMTFSWNGAGNDGKPLPRGRYVAELAFKDDSGKVIQKSETLFLHDSETAQRANFGEIEGQLSMDATAGAASQAANATIELVTKDGRVVQSVHSTDQGNYRFKNVSKGGYTVRVKKAGFASKEAEVEAKPSAPATKADMKLQ
jgi:hypothetical protein